MGSSPPPSSSCTQADRSPSGGCLRRFLIPPLAIVITSLILWWGLKDIEVVQAESSARSPQQLSPDQGGISALFTPEIQAWESQILIWSEKYQLDPNLVATVMQIESCGYQLAQSGAGAMGLFQVMPYHFQEGEDPYHPGTNAKRGLKYLRMSQEAASGSRVTLAGYNGGITGASFPEDQWPEETRRYVYWGHRIYRDARDGLDHSARLNEWLAAGGASLCKKAANSLK